MPQLKKKSFRERIQTNDAMMNRPSTSAFAKGGEFETTPSYEPNAYPGEIAEGAAATAAMPAEPKQASTSPHGQEQVDPADEQTAQFLQNSQTLDGPESGKVAPEQVPNPDAFAKFYRKWRSVPTSLNPQDKKMFQDKLAQLDQKMMEAETTYAENKNRLMWAEAAEQLGQAVIQLFAAQDAAKNNWSMNGMKFDKNNWESKFDRALREFDSRKDTIAKQQSTVSRELDKAESKQEREGTKEQSLLARDFFTTQAKIEADARRAARDDASKLKDQAAKERAAREKSRMYIANYEAAEDAVNKLEAGDFKDDKEKDKLKEQIMNSLRKNGHAGVSKDLAPGGKGAAGKTGGFWGLFQSDDYAPMKKYIQTNKKKGVESVYRGYGAEIPQDVKDALEGVETPEAPQSAGEVERQTQDGRTAVFDAKTKQFLRYK